MGDFQAAFRASRLWKGVLLLWLGLVWLGLWWAMSGVMLAVAMLMALAIGVWNWQEYPIIKHLHIDEAHQAWLMLHHDEHNWHAAQLLSGSLIHRWGCFLRWRCGQGVYWQMVLPDMLDTESYRRLRVWALFGQKT